MKRINVTMKFIFAILLCLSCAVQLCSAEPTVRIAGRADFLKTGDTIILSVSPYAGRLNEIKSVYRCAAGEGTFEFLIPAQSKPVYVRLQFQNASANDLSNLLLFPGDNLDLRIQSGSLSFDGPSAARFEVQKELLSLGRQSAREFHTIYRPEFLAQTFAHLDSLASGSLKILTDRKTAIGSACFLRLSEDIYMAAATAKFNFINYGCMNKPAEIEESFKSAFKIYGKPVIPATREIVFDKSGKPVSGYATELVYQQYLVDSCIFMHRPFDLHQCYRYEAGSFSGEFRDELVIELFIMKRAAAGSVTADMDEALGYLTDNKLRDLLAKIRYTNTAGKIAPDFTLVNAMGRQINLKDFRGKLVVLDFWFTGCGACRQMAPVMQALEKRFDGQPVVFITISIDKSRTLWLETLRSNIYTSPMSINLFTEGRGESHDVIRNFDVHGYPTIIMIDKNGAFCPKPDHSEAGISGMIDKYL
ncbi:thiol-disulfide isomerase/thioredoxin [Mucilaginibacter sp. SG538B]|uniref:TlpA family protein disulfide reductase n=1 Tax=Mucilaginibacter sp. SG538B TaxID=2587021 RepID=UPI00159E08AC|nr:TlpA disulfide reductase family protein [Mucilaginibacter sp. SG538B]NVM66869.1 thiol-disulfide isomerase/thioredoxin [Mucilaginibacter sp. SG538B]